MRRVVRAARELGVRYLTLYAFSAQNWERPAAEVADLMQLLLRFVLQERAELNARGIRLTTIGDETRLPAVRARSDRRAHRGDPREPRHDAVPGAVVRRARIDRARRAAARARGRRRTAGARGDRRRSTCARALDTRALPPPDLLIRTSGEQRLSNFLLWECAYAELYFTDVMWPDFGREHLLAAVEAFSRRQRRFGRADESVA